MDLLKIKILNTCIEGSMNREFEEYGLTYNQVTIIGILSKNKDCRIVQKDLEKILGLAHPTVSGILKRMEANGWISCSSAKEDGRLKVISLTPNADEMVELVENKVKTFHKRYLQGLTNEEIQSLENIIDKMTNNRF